MFLLISIVMLIGLLAPPLGMGLYTACAVRQVPIEGVARPIAKYLAVLFVTLLLIVFAGRYPGVTAMVRAVVTDPRGKRTARSHLEA